MINGDSSDRPAVRDSGGVSHGDAAALGNIMRIPVTLKVVIGSATLPVSTLAALEPGSLVKLDRGVGDKVDVVANGRVIARGEIVVLDEAGARYGVSIDEIVAVPHAR